ncbi:MAG: metal-dependent hydrolase [Acidobacteria bacterium]|nr:metal-dependent hydrolase [Acidobacteriota bacterium]
MDNICHTLVGAACAEAGLKRSTRFGAATLMIAANLPDLDVLVFATDMPSVAFRRGWTHGVLAQLLLPLLLALVMMAVGRWRRGDRGAPGADGRALVLLAYVGVLSHVGLDYLNTYGIRLLMPFSGRWFYGDTLFIIDPWLWILLGGGIAATRRLRREAPARAGLGVATAYAVVMLIAAQTARSAVLDAWQTVHGGPPSALMVGPVPVNPFRRDIVVDAGDRYETGTFAWFPTGVRFDARTV